MLSLEGVVELVWRGVERTSFPFGGEPLNSLALAGAAALLAGVSPAIEVRAADAPTLRLFQLALMADGGRFVPPAATCDGNGLCACTAVPGMADSRAEMAAGERLIAGPVAAGGGVFAGCAVLVCQLGDSWRSA